MSTMSTYRSPYTHAQDIKPGDKFRIWENTGPVTCTVVSVSCRIAYDDGFRGWDANGLKPTEEGFTPGFVPCMNNIYGGPSTVEEHWIVDVETKGSDRKRRTYCFHGSGWNIYQEDRPETHEALN